MKPATFIRFDDGVWQLWIRYMGIRLMIHVGDYGSRAAALADAATIDGIGGTA